MFTVWTDLKTDVKFRYHSYAKNARSCTSTPKHALIVCYFIKYRQQLYLSCCGYRTLCSRGKSPNMGRCIISYQEVLSSLLKNVNHQADEAGLCKHSINGQLLRTSVLTGHLCFGALWNFCLSLNCDSWAVEGKLLFWISLVLSSLLSVIFNTCFGSLVEF